MFTAFCKKIFYIKVRVNSGKLRKHLQMKFFCFFEFIEEFIEEIIGVLRRKISIKKITDSLREFLLKS